MCTNEQQKSKLNFRAPEIYQKHHVIYCQVRHWLLYLNLNIKKKKKEIYLKFKWNFMYFRIYSWPFVLLLINITMIPVVSVLYPSIMYLQTWIRSTL